jgi:hypothetical protein
VYFSVAGKKVTRSVIAPIAVYHRHRDQQWVDDRPRPASRDAWSTIANADSSMGMYISRIVG